MYKLKPPQYTGIGIYCINSAEGLIPPLNHCLLVYHKSTTITRVDTKFRTKNYFHTGIPRIFNLFREIFIYFAKFWRNFAISDYCEFAKNVNYRVEEQWSQPQCCSQNLPAYRYHYSSLARWLAAEEKIRDASDIRPAGYRISGRISG
jgi:hypothetical protein